MSILILRLEGPLQSWGEHSLFFQEGDTAEMPTKSGIVGLLACALGIPKDAPNEIAALSDALSIGVRADRPGRMRVDFQIVHANRLQTGKHGMRAPEKSILVSHKRYLEDAAFTVVLSSKEETLIQKISKALQHPVWSIFLGRKSCVPTRPVYDGLLEGDNLLQALKTIPLMEPRSAEESMKRVMVELEEDAPCAHGCLRNDVPSSRNRYFYSRLVHRFQIPIPKESEQVVSQ